ncbi:hypothetical protein NEMIN01_1974 [Nematocida minor]|uniref:uncharacterized protein n=1 Tax=Nematocida minor TaxID=1912983 RepID=UPI00221FB57D|nr:uncharacterized protein NEMIN01_1974 [Nematocida minor]KAI5192360.1 hypothetical protein NEMIN01_1974 [Nematocida minor]
MEAGNNSLESRSGQSERHSVDTLENSLKDVVLDEDAYSEIFRPSSVAPENANSAQPDTTTSSNPFSFNTTKTDGSRKTQLCAQGQLLSQMTSAFGYTYSVVETASKTFEGAGILIEPKKEADQPADSEKKPLSFDEVIKKKINDYFNLWGTVSKAINSIDKFFNCDETLGNGLFFVFSFLLGELGMVLFYMLYGKILACLAVACAVRYFFVKSIKDTAIYVLLTLIAAAVLSMWMLNWLIYILIFVYSLMFIAWIKDENLNINYLDISIIVVVAAANIALFFWSGWINRAMSSVSGLLVLQGALIVVLLFNSGMLRYIFRWIKKAAEEALMEKKSAEEQKEKIPANEVFILDQDVPKEDEKDKEGSYAVLKKNGLMSLFEIPGFWICVIFAIAIITGLGIFIGVNLTQPKVITNRQLFKCVPGREAFLKKELEA